MFRELKQDINKILSKSSCEDLKLHMGHLTTTTSVKLLRSITGNVYKQVDLDYKLTLKNGDIIECSWGKKSQLVGKNILVDKLIEYLRKRRNDKK